MSSKKDIVRKIQEKFGAKAAEPEQDIDPDKPFVQYARREKRLYQQHRGKGGTGKVHDALRLGPRPGKRRATGSPHWFRVMQYETARRKALEKVSLDRLSSAVGQIAVDLYHGGFKNVWQVSQVEDINELLRVGRHGASYTGVRSQELKKLREYLVQQRVPVKWDV